VQIRLVADGYDPMLGIMHSDRDDAAAFVFDIMEPERPKVDEAVLGFLKSEALHPADFTIREDGVVNEGLLLVPDDAELSALMRFAQLRVL
jgi:CRISP-associated protein Cas1